MPSTTARRIRPTFGCGDCGAALPKWVGRCPECEAWGTVAELAAPPATGLRSTLLAGRVTTAAQPISQVDSSVAARRPSGVAELDRVLGGGLVPGAVVLLAGEPGVGKSTLLLEVAARHAAGGHTVLLVSGEESAAQIKLRADRTGAVSDGLWLAAETDLSAVLAHVDQVAPQLLIVDSVQTVASPDVDGSAGGTTQVREVAAALTRVAKDRGITTLLIGHVTKDGAIAGPRVLEHLVDVVLHFEGERTSSLRLVRAVKNRYGAADEVGCFEMLEDGIRGVPDPSGLFLTTGTRAPEPGTCVTVTVEGRRPLVAEVQALVAKSALPNPRRAVSGLDAARVAMALAVLDRRGGMPLHTSDVYTATVGGMRVIDPAADLALALAVHSAGRDVPLPAGLVALGELGLSGELRPVPGLARRLAEAARLGFRVALIPAADAAQAATAGIRCVAVPDLRAALAAVTELSRAERQQQAVTTQSAASPVPVTSNA